VLEPMSLVYSCSSDAPLRRTSPPVGARFLLDRRRTTEGSHKITPGRIDGEVEWTSCISAEAKRSDNGRCTWQIPITWRKSPLGRSRSTQRNTRLDTPRATRTSPSASRRLENGRPDGRTPIVKSRSLVDGSHQAGIVAVLRDRKPSSKGRHSFRHVPQRGVEAGWIDAHIALGPEDMMRTEVSR
jgi:hypothetical protein